MNDPCELLPWDTEFFGVRIARCLHHTLTTEWAREIDRWCAANQIDCLYLLADMNDRTTTLIAESTGYQLVDVRITLACKPTLTGQPIADVRPVQQADVPHLLSIASGAFTDTRFYYDTHFSRLKVDQLYQQWVAQSCLKALRQEDMAVLVATVKCLPAGFITCQVDPANQTGSIGLLGVGTEHRGAGIGRSLVGAALDWFSTRPVSKVTVVTQGRNIAAQRLYQHARFVTENMQLYYHLWKLPQ